MKNITLNEYYTLRKLRKDIEVYASVDLSTRGRKRNVVDARKAFIYTAREKGFTFQNIGDTIGFPHDAVIYHYKKAKDLVELKDIVFADLLKNAYQNNFIEEMNIIEMKKKLKDLERLNPFLDIMHRIPEGKVWEVRDRLELFLKSYEFKTEDRLKMYVAEGTEMIGIY